MGEHRRLAFTLPARPGDHGVRELDFTRLRACGLARATRDDWTGAVVLRFAPPFADVELREGQRIEEPVASRVRAALDYWEFLL
jgi:hypothetical protein